MLEKETTKESKEKTMAKITSFLDKRVERFISKKFLVWLIATGMCMAKAIPVDTWLYITFAYLGSQTMPDIASAWKLGDKV
jgi:hypothetical protein